MKRQSNIIVIVAFIATLALGSVIGRHVDQLRKAEAFYRWLLAAGANERLFSEDTPEYKDKELFDSVTAVADSRLPELAPDKKVDQPERKVSRLGRLAGEPDHAKDIWNLARGNELAQQRGLFLDYARNRKLQFAKDIQYAEAQAGGVNVFNLFFGFRKVAATFVWIQVDRFWHQGMLYRMIPLMRTCVTLDPNFVDAYLLGAWHLAYNATAKMADTPQGSKKWDAKHLACVGEKERYYYLAVDFLKDGVQKNPYNYQLYFDLGFEIYKNKLKDYPNAVKYLSLATQQYHQVWVPRQLYICEELNGQYEDALAGWQDYMQRYPGTQSSLDTAPRFIQRNKALIYEKQMNEANAAAKAATDPAEAEKQRAAAADYKQKALQAWNAMNEPFAEYRKARMSALEMAEAGRFMEAVGILEKARWENTSEFDDASELIMDIKQQGNLPLSVSEKKAVLRNQEGDTCPGKPGR